MSRISHKHKFIFFAFPKTGSESIRKILDPYSDIKAVVKSKITKENPFYTHITPEETRNIFQEKGWNYNEYFKFVCVRNPFSRLISLYHMTFKGKAAPSFSNWILNLKPHSKERGNWFLNGQLSFHDYITDNSNSILVDKVIKLEEIDRELPKVLKQLNIKHKYIPHVNKGSYFPSKVIVKLSHQPLSKNDSNDKEQIKETHKCNNVEPKEKNETDKESLDASLY